MTTSFSIAVGLALLALSNAQFDPTFYSDPFGSGCPEGTEQSPINLYGA